MRTHEFDAVLNDVEELNDHQANALFSACCDDGTAVCSRGVAWVHFDREAASLEEAIRSAIARVESAGLRVSRVRLDPSFTAFST